jgi:hypothetical protein
MDVHAVVERLRKDVALLARPDGRMVGTEGHERARRKLLKRIRELGLEPYAGGGFVLPYVVDELRFQNIVGRIPGSDPSLPPVLLAAHYDTAGAYAGADDNAAAMAVLLASVEALRAKTLDRDVLIAFFDAEEPPHFLSPRMGSVYFYRQQRVAPIHCALVLDLVGHDVPIPGFEDLLFITGMESDPGMPAVLEAVDPGSPRILPTLNNYVGDMSDHHVFRVNQRPYLFLTCARWAHYHRQSDTPEKLNYEKMAGIQGFLVELTSAISKAALEGPFEGYDSVPAERGFMQRNMGSVVSMLGLPLETREDIDRIARVFVSQFGL